MRKTIIVFILLIIAAMALTACGKDEKPPVVVPPVDPFITPGFIQAGTTTSEMVKDLIFGVFNTIKPLTADEKNKTDVSLTAEAEIDLNGVALLAVFKLNYQPAVPGGIVFNLELLTGASKDILMGIYYYRRPAATDIYLRLSGNKIKITLPRDPDEPGALPLDVRITLAAELDALLSTVLTIEGDVRYEYANFSNGRTRHYLCKINIPESLKTIINISKLYGFDITELNFLTQNLLGVTSDDIIRDRIPRASLTIEFITKGGSQGAAGTGVISFVNLNLDVAESSIVNTVFKGEAYTAQIKVRKFEVNRTLLDSCKSESELSDYAVYTNKAFRFEAGVTYGAPKKQYLLTVDFKLDGEVSSEDKVAIYLKDKETGQNKLTIFYENNILYINVRGDDDEVQSEHFDLTLTDLLAGLESHSEENSAGLMKILVYLVGALRIENDMKLSYNFVAQNLFLVSGLNAQRLIAILDAASEDDLAAILQSAGLGADKLAGLIFDLTLNLQSEFIKFIDEVELPEDKGQL